MMVLEEDVVAEQLSSRMAPTQLSKRMLADGSFEELPQGEPVDTDASAFPSKLPEKETAGLTPAVKARDGYLLWGNPDNRPRLIDVAEGRMTLEEFVAQLPDQELAGLLGDSPTWVWPILSAMAICRSTAFPIS